MTIRLTLLALFATLCACSPSGADAARVEWSVAGVAGSYGQSGQIGHLELAPDGTYETFIFNGVTADGCATFEGAGTSVGRWELTEGAITFTPTAEPPDLVIKLAEASARPVDDGLVLTINGAERLLAREDQSAHQLDLPMQADRTPQAR